MRRGKPTADTDREGSDKKADDNMQYVNYSKARSRDQGRSQLSNQCKMAAAGCVRNFFRLRIVKLIVIVTFIGTVVYLFSDLTSVADSSQEAHKLAQNGKTSSGSQVGKNSKFAENFKADFDKHDFPHQQDVRVPAPPQKAKIPEVKVQKNTAGQQLAQPPQQDNVAHNEGGSQRHGAMPQNPEDIRQQMIQQHEEFQKKLEQQQQKFEIPEHLKQQPAAVPQNDHLQAGNRQQHIPQQQQPQQQVNQQQENLLNQQEQELLKKERLAQFQLHHQKLAQQQGKQVIEQHQGQDQPHGAAGVQVQAGEKNVVQAAKHGENEAEAAKPVNVQPQRDAAVQQQQHQQAVPVQQQQHVHVQQQPVVVNQLPANAQYQPQQPGVVQQQQPAAQPKQPEAQQQQPVAHVNQPAAAQQLKPAAAQQPVVVPAGQKQQPAVQAQQPAVQAQQPAMPQQQKPAAAQPHQPAAQPNQPVVQQQNPAIQPQAAAAQQQQPVVMQQNQGEKPMPVDGQLKATYPYSHHVLMTLTNAATKQQLRDKFKVTVSSLLQHASVDINFFIVTDTPSEQHITNIMQDIVQQNLAKVKFQMTYLNAETLTQLLISHVTMLQQHISSGTHKYYMDAIFFLSVAMHRNILPDEVKQIVMIDSDLKFRTDIKKLFSHFDNFGPGNVIGIAHEQQPVYRHTFSLYRSQNKGTLVGDPPPNGLTGFNSGVMLLDLVKMRNSISYNSFLDVDVVRSLSEKYSFKGHLGDQDFFTLMALENKDLFYVLPCTWNRQLCQWWKDKGYESVFHLYFSCPGSVNIYHGNCNTPIPNN